MAEVITMPRLSDTMTEGVVATWLKKVGDKISEGDILAEIETDKATMEFESFHSGTLLYIGLEEGEAAPVDSLLAIIGNEGEDISALINGVSVEKSSEKEDVKSEVEVVAKNDSNQEVSIPKDVKIVTMPRLSDTMTEGTVATWIKKVGDKVEEGDILAEIETDKATMEFESFQSGTLLYIGINEGESAPVDSILAIVGPEGTNVDGLVASVKAGKNPLEEREIQVERKQESVQEKVIETMPQTVTVSENTVTGRVFVSPLARKIATDKGVNLADVSGTGENGRIVKRDVENYVPSVKVPSVVSNTNVSSVKTFAPAGEVNIEEVKNSQMRKTIARRLAESKFTAPHYYLTIEISMDEAMASRKIINTLPDTKVSFNDMVVKACAMALKKHPQVNTQWKDDVTVINHHVNIGVAVAVEDGLVVPVLPFTDQMSLTQIGEKVKELAVKAKTKKLQPAEMDGSTFTVSNLGMFGIQSFTSIINQPNSAILSVGAIEEKPVVKNGQIVVGNTMTVTLACDHRTVDGATGAQFLQTLRSYIENPVTMLA
ncbi:pyruvate dehydrogenase E2 component (dihydrolipoamide acetyltransferase) [Myroides guanonis]|uniref:Dihydrolipoamide acetyltransferase component of pyruvate dehydrogenase complex n=1 Tax=Myroides guanonis TaxID=1150112 RepID=A0A1I3MAN0_9FLAO|nr:pyruvate dehydrogenase complex dihydrolipoamide acetyltransferase [Myroides guanonis]SFI93785.1 pyruvate dehydrogenase E2 component (dihydrolipoamide acetyltransferase) [Myroides guanonis]